MKSREEIRVLKVKILKELEGLSYKQIIEIARSIRDVAEEFSILTEPKLPSTEPDGFISGALRHGQE